MLRVQLFITPVLSRCISARLLSVFVPQVENKVKGAPLAEIQESIADELNKIQKRGIFARFLENLRLRKNLYICQWCLF
jgi:hypothetical protein